MPEKTPRKTTLAVNGFGNTNSSTTPEAHRKETVKRNSPAYILHNFFGDKSIQLLYTLNDGTLVGLHRNSNPYGVDLQTVAMPKQAMEWGPDDITGIRLSDMSDEAQYKYWQIANAQLVAMHDLPDPEHIKRNKVFDRISGAKRKSTDSISKFLAENDQVISWIDRRSPNIRTPRTIFIRHLHGSTVKDKWVKAEDWKVDHIDRQNAQLGAIMNSPFGDQFVSTIKQFILEHAPTNEAKQRISQSITFGKVDGTKDAIFHPIGYSLTVNSLNPQNLTKPDATRFVKDMMLLHEKAYIAAMNQLKQNLSLPTNTTGVSPEDITMPQPAFARFVQFEKQPNGEEQYVMTISPTLNSNGGIFEIAGVQLLRGKEHPYPLSKKQTVTYQRRIVRAVWRETKKDKSYEKSRMNNKPNWLTRRRKFNEPDLP